MTGLLFGLAPALQATRIDPGPALKESCLAGTGSRSRRRFSLQSLLVISQVAISLLLLTGAGLFMRTLANLQSIETGFRRENLLVFRLNAWQAGYRDSALFAFYKNLESRFAAIPGVRSAARANNPLIGAGAFGWPIVPAGKPKPEHAPTGHGSGFSADATRVLATGPGFFQTTGIRLLGGREFDGRDRQGGPRVAVVNEAWTRINLNGLNPVGQHILDYGMDDKPVDMEIAGLVVNAKYDELTGEYPAVVYVPVAQYPGETTEEATFFLRTAGDPLRYASAVREIVRTADSRIPITGLMSQAAQIEGEMEEQTMMARFCTIFAALSLAIACVGLYGTTSYTIARRTGEIGIRMALGAQRATVLWAVLRDVLVLAAIGLSISAPLAAAAAKAMESFLYGVKPGDPRVLAGAAAILLAAATCAAWIPARRASRIDPMHAVRHE
jgi:predicted permease